MAVLLQPCPTCGAKPGQGCTSMRDGSSVLHDFHPARPDGYDDVLANPTGLGEHVACDHCVDFGLALHCPGVDAHCAGGEHCTTVIEICAIDAERDDHGWWLLPLRHTFPGTMISQGFTFPAVAVREFDWVDAAVWVSDEEER